jgi:hypothetical protein
MCVIYLCLIIFLVVDDILIDSETFIDFVNLKIKSAQSFKSVHRGRVCVVRKSK